ncbi:MAG TPA: DUF1932 domain-containing protein [Gaiellaceae bacterium]
MIVGVLHPGAMGSAVGDALCACGHEVLWASEGRSAETRERAAGFRDVRTVAELEAEWLESVPELIERLESAERSAAAKGWRWVGELEEIADTFAAAGEPDGFHRAAAEVFRP